MKQQELIVSCFVFFFLLGVLPFNGGAASAFGHVEKHVSLWIPVRGLGMALSSDIAVFMLLASWQRVRRALLKRPSRFGERSTFAAFPKISLCADASDGGLVIFLTWRVCRVTAGGLCASPTVRQALRIHARKALSQCLSAG